MQSIKVERRAYYAGEPDAAGKATRVAFGNAPGKDSKGNDVQIIVAETLAPTNYDEFVEWCGGADKVQKGFDLIARTFAISAANALFQQLSINDLKEKGAEFRDELVKKVVSTIENYTLAQDLTEQADKDTKIAVADKFGQLDPSDPDFMAKFLELQKQIKF